MFRAAWPSSTCPAAACCHGEAVSPDSSLFIPQRSPLLAEQHVAVVHHLVVPGADLCDYTVRFGCYLFISFID